MSTKRRERMRRAVLSHSIDQLVPAGEDSPFLRQQIIGALRRAIELGRLQAGERIVEKDLCQQLGVSRTSLREALRELEANGVVNKISARTTVITTVSPADIQSMSRVRAALESMLVEQFTRNAVEADFAALRKNLRLQRSINHFGAAALDANRAYYQAWCNGAGNQFAFTVLMNIQLRLSVRRAIALKSAKLRWLNLANQRAVVGCMARGEIARAKQLVHRNNRYGAELLIDSSDPEQDTSSVERRA